MNDFVLDLQNIDSHEKAFLLFRHILLGVTYDCHNNFYVKHNSLVESTYVNENNKILEIEIKKRGLFYEKQKLEILFKNGSWTKQQEDFYQDQLKRLQDLQISKKKLVIPAQIKMADQILNEEISKFSSAFIERDEILGLTVEGFLSSKNYQFYLENFFFKDSRLNIRLFSEQELEDMSLETIKNYYSYYNDFQEVFNERNLKKITCCPLVLNVLFLSKTPLDFFGKPISELSMNQITLYNNYVYYKSIITNPEAKQPPQELYNSLDKLVDFYDQQRSFLNTKNTSKK
jgi:hypothetical protein